MSTALRRSIPPGLFILAGVLISMLTFGPRSTMGFFMQPMAKDVGYSASVFAFGFALQNLMWGIGQPFAGALADKYGTHKVLIGGTISYMLGLAMMVWARDPLSLYFTMGVLIGFGTAGASFNVVLAAFGKLLPPEKRGVALGLGTAAGSFGQFLFSPLAPALIDGVGWGTTLMVFAALQVVIIPLAFLLWTPTTEAQPETGATGGPQSIRAALSEALAHPSYVLLVLGFFTCGFQLAFITGHLPQFLADAGIGTVRLFGRDVSVGGLTLAFVGLFNIVGSLTSGWLINRMPKRYLLAFIYAGRSIAIVAFITMPITATSALVFGAVMGLFWLSTVPPTSNLVAMMFGVRYMAMLFGFCFFSHQVGGFLGAWLGGIFYEATKSYDVVWWLSIAFGFASAAINLPIKEQAVERRAVPAAA